MFPLTKQQKMKKAIIIFVRNPELGKVKTRLAVTAGNEAALNIYQKLLLHTLQVSKKSAADKFVFYHEKIELDDIWNEPGFYKIIQSGTDLGDKMKNAFAAIFERSYKQVIIIGSDCLQLTSQIITQAFEKLNNNDAVIGPARDGGYYLLGMKKLSGFLFDNKSWSTNTVFAETIKDFELTQLSFKKLPVLLDVDTEADWLESKMNYHAL